MMSNRVFVFVFVCVLLFVFTPLLLLQFAVVLIFAVIFRLLFIFAFMWLCLFLCAFVLLALTFHFAGFPEVHATLYSRFMMKKMMTLFDNLKTVPAYSTSEPYSEKHILRLSTILSNQAQDAGQAPNTSHNSFGPTRPKMEGIVQTMLP